MKRSSSLCLRLLLAVVAAPAALPAQTPTFSSRQISAGAPSGGTANLGLSGNFNGNGNTDLIVGVSGPSTPSSLKFLTGDGTGNFTASGSVNLGQQTAALVADVNGDGKDDIITLLPGCDELPCSNNPNEGDGDGIITVLLSQGNGTFKQGFVGTLPSGLNSAKGVVGDFNKDGKPDIAVLAYEANGTFDASGDALLCIFINQGNGTFTQTVYPTPDTLSTGVPAPTNLVTGDFEGNGNEDVAFAFESQDGTPVAFPEVLTFAGDGKGDFGPGVVSYTFDSGLSTLFQTNLYAADLNGDGRTDLVIGLEGKPAISKPTRVPSLLANVNGKFHWSSAVYIAGSPIIALSDVNGDGKPDLVFLDNGEGTVAAGVYLGLGNGAFKTPRIPLTATGSPSTSSIAMVPLKKGALPSIIVSGFLQTLQLFVNTTK